MAWLIKVSAKLTAFIVVMFVSLSPSFAEQKPEESTVTTHRENVSIIHVDQIGVYVPNRIFYWDDSRGKNDLDALRKQAVNLKNRRAAITYSLAGEGTSDRRPLIVSIEASQEQDILSTVEISSPGEAFSPDITEPQALMESSTEASSRPHATDETLPAPTSQEPLAITREEITSFVQNVLNLNSRKDIDAFMSHFGDRVDYHGSGLVSKDHVRRDTIHYFNSWDSIFCTLDSEVVMIVTDERQVRIAKFLSRFRVKNSTASVKGLTENIWTLRRVGDRLILVGMRQNVLNREILPP